jgi:hypothetical protein
VGELELEASMQIVFKQAGYLNGVLETDAIKRCKFNCKAIMGECI